MTARAQLLHQIFPKLRRAESVNKWINGAIGLVQEDKREQNNAIPHKLGRRPPRHILVEDKGGAGSTKEKEHQQDQHHHPRQLGLESGAETTGYILLPSNGEMFLAEGAAQNAPGNAGIAEDEDAARDEEHDGVGVNVVDQCYGSIRHT